MNWLFKAFDFSSRFVTISGQVPTTYRFREVDVFRLIARAGRVAQRTEPLSATSNRLNVIAISSIYCCDDSDDVRAPIAPTRGDVPPR